MGRGHLIVGRQNIVYGTILVVYGSPNCVLFCFVGRQPPNVENHWSQPYKKSLSWKLKNTIVVDSGEIVGLLSANRRVGADLIADVIDQSADNLVDGVTAGTNDLWPLYYLTPLKIGAIIKFWLYYLLWFKMRWYAIEEFKTNLVVCKDTFL